MQEHETATLSWLKAEGTPQIVLIQMRKDGAIKPAKQAKGASLAKLMKVRESAFPSCYDAVTSAGTLLALGGNTIFMLATPAQVDAYNESASRL